MKIGELAEATGANVQTIRFYEREGLLPTPARGGNDYRVYADADLERLAFIRHCRSLDMTLPEIRSLLRFKDAPQEPCGEVDALLDGHIGRVAQRVRQLRTLERELKRLRARCGSTADAGECGILEALSHPLPRAPERPARSVRRSPSSTAGGDRSGPKGR